MWAAMNSETNSSTTMELGGATMAVQQQAPTHIASGSWAMVQKANQMRSIVATAFRAADEAYIEPKGQAITATLAYLKHQFGNTEICPEAQEYLDELAANPHQTQAQL